MADNNEEVTLKSVFKDLADALTTAVTAGDEEPEAKTEEEIKAEAKAKEEAEVKAKEEAETKAKAEAEAKTKADAEAAKAAKGDGEGDKPEPATKAEVEALVAKIAVIEQLLTAEDGDFRTAMTKLVETTNTHAEALEKVIGRVENLESGTAVSKSIDGDDSGGDENESETPVEKSEQKGLASLSKAVTHMARNPKGAPVS